jgi:hypothetical protein
MIKLVETFDGENFRTFITEEIASIRYGKTPRRFSKERNDGTLILPYYIKGRSITYDQDVCDKIVLEAVKNGSWGGVMGK